MGARKSGKAKATRLKGAEKQASRTPKNFDGDRPEAKRPKPAALPQREAQRPEAKPKALGRDAPLVEGAAASEQDKAKPVRAKDRAATPERPPQDPMAKVAFRRIVQNLGNGPLPGHETPPEHRSARKFDLPRSLAEFARLQLNDPMVEKKIAEMRGSGMFSELPLTDPDWRANVSALWSVYRDNEACLRDKGDKCLKPSGYHLAARFDGRTRRITFGQCLCEKYLQTLREYTGSKNFVIKPKGGFLDTALPSPKALFESLKKESDKAAMNKWWEGVGRDFGKDRGAYIWGPPGSGKTYVASVMANFLAKPEFGSATKRPRGSYDRKVAFLSTIEMLADLKQAFKDDAELSMNGDKVANADLLVIDDLGSEAPREWFVSEWLTRIINRRNRPGLVTVFISNFSPGELRAHYAEGVNVNAADRLLSRISGIIGDKIMRVNAFRAGTHARVGKDGRER